MHPAEYLDMQAVKEEKISLRGKTVTWSQDTKIVSNLLQVTSMFIFFLIWPTSVRQLEPAQTQATEDSDESPQYTII